MFYLKKMVQIVRYPSIIGVFLFIFQPSVQAAEVSAQFFQRTETATIIEIRAPKKLPSTLIVEMKVPIIDGTISAKPGFSKLNKKARTVKWLLKDVTSSPVTIVVNTSKPLDLEAVNVVVRFRNRAAGTVEEIAAKMK